MSIVTLPKASVPIGTLGNAPVLINPQWMRAFNDLLARTGGTTSASTGDIQEALAEGLTSLSQAPLAPQPVTVDQIAADLGQLRDQVGEVVKALDDLRKGVQL